MVWKIEPEHSHLATPSFQGKGVYWMWTWKCVTPHPPIIVHEVGKGRESESARTVDAMKRLSEILSGTEPEFLLLLTPHHHFAQGLHMIISKKYEGNLGMFGAPEVSLSLNGDPGKAQSLAEHLSSAIPLSIEKKNRVMLDHASLVPLAFMSKRWHKIPTLLIANPLGLSRAEAFETGKMLASFEDKSSWGLIASGDLSHRLSYDAPSGFHEDGSVFDAKLVEALRDNNPAILLELDKEIIENAGECGLKSVLVYMGVMRDVPSRVLSYEGPFGVGYCVAYAGPECTIKHSKTEDPIFTRIARRAISTYLSTGKMPAKEAELASSCPVLKEQKACFVSLKTKVSGELRGCIGTISPIKNDLAEEIVHNAISAAFQDPRFEPLTEPELEDVTISVDVLSFPEITEELIDLDPSVYGVIVEKGFRRGVLLPDLEGITSVEQQLKIAARKAGIDDLSSATIYRFTVTRYIEKQGAGD